MLAFSLLQQEQVWKVPRCPRVASTGGPHSAILHLPFEGQGWCGLDLKRLPPSPVFRGGAF